MNKRILSILVENTAGVLSRVSGLFSRRGYNIDSLSVGITTDPNYSRMTVVCSGDELILEQITKQVEKLEDVLTVKVLKDGQSVNRELILVKVRVEPNQRADVSSIVDIFRANIKNGTELGMEAKKYMDQGLLVPDELTVRILLDRVAQDDCKNGYVLDGFPRTIPQAEVLDSELTRLGDHIDYAINVDVPDENIVKRMSGRRACLTCGATYHIEHVPPKKEGICDVCGSELVLRDDDKPETVKNRLNVYHEQTQPLIDFYTEKGVLKTVDGTVPMEEVFAAITAILG